MATINTTCPACSAPHARKLSVIFQEGLSTVQTDIDTVGTFNTIGRQKIKTKGTATGVQQTQASKDAAPPEVPGLVTRGEIIRAIVMIAGIGLCVTGFFSDSTTVATVGIVAIVGSSRNRWVVPRARSSDGGGTSESQAGDQAFAGR